MQTYKYVVTCVDAEATQNIKTSLTDSSYFSRIVEIANEKPNNPRNTEYFLSELEADTLRQDSLVVSVEWPDAFTPSKKAFQDGTFSKDPSNLGEFKNWGLLRHNSNTNIFGTSTADPGGTYDYVLDGTGVDVVIVDSGIQANHPEFQDADGNSRVQEIDWFAESGVAGTMPAGHYSDYDGHGTHVASTVAGKLFGWAKNAHIYSIKINGLQGASDPNPGINALDAMDCILGWHQNKTNGRPTVVNHSWGYNISWNAAADTLERGGATYPIIGGVYRGVPWTGTTRDPSGKGHPNRQTSTNFYSYDDIFTAIDVDMETHANAGIISCVAAGNASMKEDVDGGIDYDNYISATGFGRSYYHRQGSPAVDPTKGFNVGSIGAGTNGGLETKSSFSDGGPSVNVWAAGSNIMGAMSGINDNATSFQYEPGGSFFQEVYSGTSMASPQIAGMCALLLQVHPDWSPQQVVSWFQHHSISALYSTGQDNDYVNNESLLGSTDKVAFFPMNGQRYFQQIAS